MKATPSVMAEPLGEPARVQICYEAGPTGYGRVRRLRERALVFYERFTAQRPDDPVLRREQLEALDALATLRVALGQDAGRLGGEGGELDGVAHGDALVAEFSKASDAVNAAVEFQVSNRLRLLIVPMFNDVNTPNRLTMMTVKIKSCTVQ